MTVILCILNFGIFMLLCFVILCLREMTMEAYQLHTTLKKHVNKTMERKVCQCGPEDRLL